MTTVTVDQVLRGLAAAVSTKGPGHRYAATKDESPNTTCYYSKPQGDTPGDWTDGCIVGQALIAIGVVTPKDLEDMDGDGWVPNENSTLPNKVEVDPVAGHVLWEAQQLQDAGHTWWDAMREAQRAALSFYR